MTGDTTIRQLERHHGIRCCTEDITMREKTWSAPNMNDRLKEDESRTIHGTGGHFLVARISQDQGYETRHSVPRRHVDYLDGELRISESVGRFSGHTTFSASHVFQYASRGASGSLEKSPASKQHTPCNMQHATYNIQFSVSRTVGGRPSHFLDAMAVLALVRILHKVASGPLPSRSLGRGKGASSAINTRLAIPDHNTQPT